MSDRKLCDCENKTDCDNNADAEDEWCRIDYNNGEFATPMTNTDKQIEIFTPEECISCSSSDAPINKPLNEKCPGCDGRVFYHTSAARHCHTYGCDHSSAYKIKSDQPTDKQDRFYSLAGTILDHNDLDWHLCCITPDDAKKGTKILNFNYNGLRKLASICRGLGISGMTVRSATEDELFEIGTGIRKTSTATSGSELVKKAQKHIKDSLALKVEEKTIDGIRYCLLPRSEFMSIHDALHYSRDCLSALSGKDS